MNSVQHSENKKGSSKGKGGGGDSLAKRLSDAQQRLQVPPLAQSKISELSDGLGGLAIGAELVAGIVVSTLLVWGMGEVLGISIKIRAILSLVLGMGVNGWSLYKRVRAL